MNWESIVTTIGSLLGAGVLGALASAWVSRYTAKRTADNEHDKITLSRDQWFNEAQQKLVDQAMEFQGRYEGDNAKLTARIIEIQQLLQTEQAARRRDAADCKAAINEIGVTKDREIGMLQAKVTVLQNQVSNLKGQNTSLRRRITDLENGTGELKTPPPHDVSTFIDPPPSEEAAEDWD